MSHQITRKYPGKSATEIYAKVDEIMQRVAEKMSLEYSTDHERKTGKVSKMGATGAYFVKDGEVTVDLKFPMLVPGSMRQRVQGDIEKRLDGLFV